MSPAPQPVLWTPARTLLLASAAWLLLASLPLVAAAGFAAAGSGGVGAAGFAAAGLAAAGLLPPALAASAPLA